MWNTWKGSQSPRHKAIQSLDFSPFYLEQGGICRLVEARDLSRIVVLQQYCYEGYVAWDLMKLMDDFSRNPFAVYWQIEVSGKMVAVLIGRLLMRDAHLSHLMVLPEYRGRGYGRHLLQMWQAALLELQIPQATLEVGISNEAAQSLYRQVGYRVIAEIPGYYDYLNETALVMRVQMDGSETR